MDIKYEYNYLPTELKIKILEHMTIPDVYALYNTIPESKEYINEINTKWWVFPTKQEDINNIIINACKTGNKETISYIIYNISDDNNLGIDENTFEKMAYILISNNHNKIVIYLIEWLNMHEKYNHFNIDYDYIYKIFYNNAIKYNNQELINLMEQNKIDTEKIKQMYFDNMINELDTNDNDTNDIINTNNDIDTMDIDIINTNTDDMIDSIDIYYNEDNEEIDILLASLNIKLI